MKATLLSIAMVVAVTCWAQPTPDTLWTLQLDGIYNEQANAVAEAARGYLIVGTTSGYAGNPTYMFVVRTNLSGDTLWTRRWDGEAYDVLVRGDMFYIVGKENQFSVIRIVNDLGELMETQILGSGCAHCINKTSGGGFVIAGYTGGANPDCIIMLFSEPGFMLWSSTWGLSGADILMSVAEEIYGDFIGVGYSNSMGHGMDDWLLQQSMRNGFVFWLEFYGTPYSDRAHSVIMTSDLCYIIGGYAACPPDYNQNMFVRKRGMGINSTIWTYTIGKEESIGAVYSVEETPDLNYMAAGTIARPPSYDNELCLAKLTNYGELMWERDYPGDATHDNYGYSGMRTSDGGYIIVGSTTGENADGLDLYVVKTGVDYSGHDPQMVLSTDTLDFGRVLLEHPEELPLTIYSTGDTTLILRDIYTSQHCFWVTWDIEDSLLYPADSAEISVYFSPDDSITFNETLYIESNVGPVEIHLTGTGVIQLTVPGELAELPDNYALHAPYPNPFNAVTTISYDIPVSSMVRVDVYDVLGKKVATLVDGNGNTGRHQVMWNAGEMPSGVYFMSMVAGDFRQIRKLVILK